MTIVRIKAELPKQIKFVKISEHKPGDSLVLGKLISTEEVDNYNKDGKVNLHKFETEAGIVAINSNKVLDKLIAQFPVGSTLEIFYTGKEHGVRKDGKKIQFNMFEVELLTQKAS